MTTTPDIPTNGWSEEAYIRRLMQMGGLRRFPRTLRYHARNVAQKNNGAPCCATCRHYTWNLGEAPGACSRYEISTFPGEHCPDGRLAASG